MEARSLILMLTKRIAMLFAVTFGFLGGTCMADTPQMVLQLGMSSGARCIAMSPNGKYIVTAGYADRGALLWNAAKGVILAHLIPPACANSKPIGVYMAVFSPDSRQIALGDAANGISVWDTSTGALVSTIPVPGPERQVENLQIDRTGKRLMASVAYGPVVMFSLATGKPLYQWFATIEGHQARARTAELSADGKRILTLTMLAPPNHSENNLHMHAASLQMHDARTGKILWQKALKQPSLEFTAYFVPGDTKILLLMETSAIICRASDGKKLTQVHCKQPMLNASLSPDGKTAAITGIEWGGLYSMADGRLRNTIPGAAELVRSSYAPDGHALLTASYTGDVRVLSARNLHMLRTLPGSGCPSVDSIAASPDGQTYAIVAKYPFHTGAGIFQPSGTCVLLLFDVKTGTLRQQIALGPNWHVPVTFAPDSTRITCLIDSNLLLFDTTTGTMVVNTSAKSESSPVEFTADGNDVLTHNLDNKIYFRSSVSGNLIKTLTLTPGSSIECYALSPDGQMLAVSVINRSGDQLSNDVELWDVALQTRIKVLSPPQPMPSTSQPINSPLVFSPDGKTLVVGNLGATAPNTGPGTRPTVPIGSTLDLYSIPDGTKRATISDYGEQVAFSPDSKILFTPSGTAWDVQSAQALWHTTSQEAGDSQLAITVNGSGQGSVITSPAEVSSGGPSRYAPGADDDRRLTIRDAKTGRVKATIYLLPLKETPTGLEAEWLTVTPDGYYCGSPGSSHWVRWRSGTSMLPADALEAQRNNPDHVQQALKTKG